MPAIDVAIGYGITLEEAGNIPEDFDFKNYEEFENYEDLVEFLESDDEFRIVSASSHKRIMFDAQWPQNFFDFTEHAKNNAGLKQAHEQIQQYLDKRGFTDYNLDNARWWICCRNG